MSNVLPTGQADRLGTSRAALRRAMFLSQDSVVLCMTLRALEELDLLGPSLQGDCSLSDLGAEGAGFGALRVALHSLASTGWLDGPPTLDPRTTYLRWTEAGRTAVVHRDRYLAVADFLAGFASTAPDTWLRMWNEDQVDRFGELVGRASARWEFGGDQPSGHFDLMRAHLDLALAVPTMLWLHETGRVGGVGPEMPDDRAGEGMARLLTTLGWLDGESGGWTASGQQARAFALNFGGVVTYLPLLARLAEIYRGELTVAPDSDGGEWHVHRELNLRISAAAHRRYFAESESIFVEIFERDPIEEQPRFIADMGCGDGSWLAHLYGLIERQTRRGQQLDSHPLTMVGVDPDAGAREMALRNLEEVDAPAIVMSGDVTDPDRLQVDLAKRGLQIEDGLHIRAFIDHERRYLGGKSDQWAPGWASGVYIDADGRPLSGEDVERDLIASLRRWETHTRKHGLVVLEAHCVAPSVAFRHLGSLHGIAFDAHQAYSRQYPVDHASFLRCCQEAGLQSAGHCERRYPAGQPFVSIGLNRLRTGGGDSPLPSLGSTAPREDTWRPESGVDLEDGIALHDILFTHGDVRYPSLWCSPPTGFVIAGALEGIEKRLASARSGDTIRVMDYGAGTGTATIELLKACRERGIEQRLERLGVRIEVHLLDLPSSWFAQGYELLGECGWTRFHSVRAADGSFRPIAEVVEGQAMDVVMANMVFHLIPPRALERSADGLASVLAADGTLVWSAPDLGPPGVNSVLLHDPNRALREHWLELLAGAGAKDLSPALGEALRRAREELDEESLQAAQQRADRRIRPRPLATEVVEALETRFVGEIQTTAFEMLGEDVVRGLLVPSNQAEYMPEIPDRELREGVIRELMLDVVLPRMRAGPAGTSLGINLHWTLGKFSRRPRSRY